MSTPIDLVRYVVYNSEKRNNLAKKKTIEVMLTSSDIKANCKPGDIAKVRHGYAKHYLIPRGLALLVKGNEEIIKEKMTQWQEEDDAKSKKAKLTYDAFDQKNIVLSKQCGPGGALYGSISAKDVSKILSGDDQNADTFQVCMDKIKTIGTYSIRVKLYGGLTAKMTLDVKAKS